eukprot:m.133294 g.133294  ORF g.133294 m.133294 type:complete len:119 (+) comp38122_c1_seq2:2015-2371(+)
MIPTGFSQDPLTKLSNYSKATTRMQTQNHGSSPDRLRALLGIIYQTIASWPLLMMALFLGWMSDRQALCSAFRLTTRQSRVFMCGSVYLSFLENADSSWSCSLVSQLRDPRVCHNGIR